MAIGGYLGICFCLAVIAVSKGANLDCDFKTNFCQWTNGSSVRHWKRHSFATLTPGTGPDIGHTTQEGVDYYIYLHAGEKKNKDGLVESGKCVLLSPAFNTTSGGSCFRFWYHMKGNGIGNLSAAVVEGSSSVSVWSKTGQQGADWKCAAFIIEQGKEDLQIAMTAWTGLNVIGDIALDDFKFVEKCNETTDLCSNITPKPSSTPPTQSSTPDEQSPISTTEGVVTTTPAEDDITMTIVYIAIVPIALLIIVSVVAFVRYKYAKSKPIESNNFIWPNNNNNNPTEPDIDDYDNLQDDVYAELDESRMDRDGRVISSSTNEGHTQQLPSATISPYQPLHPRHPASSSRTETSNGITGPYMTMKTRDEDDLPGDDDYLVSIPGPNELQTGSGEGGEEDVAKAPGKEEDSSEASYHNGHGDLAEDGKKLPPVQCGRTASYISPVFENI